MKIIVDAFGGDNAPLEIIKGCAMAVEEYNFEILLVGDESKIRSVAAENNISLKNISIAHADDVITMEDSPSDIMKSKKNSSMAEGLRRLKNNEGDAFISAGNSGALVVGATMIVKRIKGIKRPAFAPVMPKNKGSFMLIDSGANVECRPEMLKQFAIMGSIYMENVMNVANPRVGLANIGVEDHKGTSLQQETFKILKETDINFIGNVEARDIPQDGADVVVADGFTGNIILKMFEGVAMTLMGKIKGLFTKNLKTKLAAALMLSDMKTLKKQIDYNEFGGAPIIGVSKPVFKAHGSSKAKTIKNALRLTALYVQGDVVGKIEREVSRLENEN